MPLVEQMPKLERDHTYVEPPAIKDWEEGLGEELYK
jgi:hypothetical protein